MVSRRQFLTLPLLAIIPVGIVSGFERRKLGTKRSPRMIGHPTGINPKMIWNTDWVDEFSGKHSEKRSKSEVNG